MSDTAFFREQLIISAAQFTWAARLIPTGRLNVLPLPIFGEWSVLRRVFHVVWQEEHILIPVLRGWTDDTILTVDPDAEESAWMARSYHLNDLLVTLQRNHEALADQADRFPAGACNTFKETPFGTVTPRWIMAHTIQHTLEQTDILLKMHLYWDMALAELKKQRQALGEERGSYQEGSEFDDKS